MIRQMPLENLSGVLIKPTTYYGLFMYASLFNYSMWWAARKCESGLFGSGTRISIDDFYSSNWHNHLFFYLDSKNHLFVVA